MLDIIILLKMLRRNASLFFNIPWKMKHRTKHLESGSKKKRMNSFKIKNFFQLLIFRKIMQQCKEKTAFC